MIQDQFGTIQNLLIPQTSNQSGTIFGRFLQQTGSTNTFKLLVHLEPFPSPRYTAVMPSAASFLANNNRQKVAQLAALHGNHRKNHYNRTFQNVSMQQPFVLLKTTNVSTFGNSTALWSIPTQCAQSFQIGQLVCK